MRAFLKWTTRLAAAVAVPLAAGCVAIFWSSESRLGRAYAVHPAPLSVAGEAVTIERGRHAATIRGCRDCHGDNLEGRVFLDDPIIGRFVASNLTGGKGGVGGSYADEDWVRAIRHGVHPNGRALLVMPSDEFSVLSDAYVASVIAYIKSVPPVDNVPPQSAVSLIGRAIMTLNRDVAVLPAERIDHAAARVPAPPVGITREYGRYLASSCVTCHGPALSGGRVPGVPPDWPPAANLTPEPGAAIARWSESGFATTLRTGVTPEGRQLDTRYMPWKVIGQMTDGEIEALWIYLRSLPSKAAGNR
jgi:mono/diheme cytochrome c family protein